MNEKGKKIDLTSTISYQVQNEFARMQNELAVLNFTVSNIHVFACPSSGAQYQEYGACDDGDVDLVNVGRRPGAGAAEGCGAGCGCGVATLPEMKQEHEDGCTIIQQHCKHVTALIKDVAMLKATLRPGRDP